MAKVLQAAVALLLVAALLAPCDGRELKASGAAASGGAAANGGSSGGGEEKAATGLPLIPTLPPVLGPGVPLPPVVPGIPPARESDKSP